MLDRWITDHDHDVRRCREPLNICRKLLILDDHRLKFVICFDARQLELLDDVGDLLEPMLIFVLLCIVVRDHEEGGPLEEDYLVSVEGLAECLEVLLQGLDVWEQE